MSAAKRGGSSQTESQTAPEFAPQFAPQFAHWRQNTWALGLAALLSSIGFSAAWPFLPLMMRNLGVTDNLESWVGHMLLVFYLVGFVAAPVWGGIADHFGRKIMVLRAMLGLGLCMMILPLAPSPLAFAGILMVMSLFNGYNPASMALLAATSPPSRMGQAMSLTQSGNLAGQALGPAVGALLVGLLTRQITVFWVSGALLLTGGVLVALLVREVHRRPPGRWRLDWLGSLRDLLAVRGIPPLFLLCFVFGMLWHGNVPVISIYTMQLIEARPESASGYSEAFWVGTMAVGMAVASIVALVAGGRLVDRYNPARVLSVTTTIAVLTHVPLLLLDSPLQLALSRVAFGLGVAIMQPALFRLLKDRAPAGMDARAISYASSIQMVAMGFAPFVAGLISPALGMRAYFALIILLTIGGLALWQRRLRAP